MISTSSHKTSPTAEDSGGRVLMRAKGLGISFGGQQVLDGVDLDIHQGEVILLRGENGSGKTTLLNILTGNLEPDTGEIHYSADETPRSYHFPRRWWQNLNPWDHFRPEFVAKEGVGRTWQDVRLFRSLSLRDNVAVAEPDHTGENPFVALTAPPRSRKHEEILTREAGAMLARFGLEGREESSGDMVSLGQSKRVAIARAVAAGAKILFLDEPLAGLDRQGIFDVLSLLELLVRERGLTLVIVEHIFSQQYLEGLITTAWLLEGGSVHRNGAIDSETSASEISHVAATERPAWFSLLVENGAEVIDQPLPRGALLTRIRQTDRWKPDAKPVLNVEKLIVKRGVQTVIGLDEEGHESGFNLKLFEGEVAILQAPNGWGKSTLFEAVCGSIPSRAEEISINQSNIGSADPWDRTRAGLSACPSSSTLFPSLRVSEATRLAFPKKSRTASGPFSHRYVSSLSGGERQSVIFRFSLRTVEETHVLLLDEPFAMLDSKTTEECLREFAATAPSLAILILVPFQSTDHINNI